MNTKAILASIMLAATATTTQAGGILTNTNQSIDFLRNPARDAAIGLDGVYSNPAGVAFLPDGFHLGFNWQYAHQTRTVTSTNSVFALGSKNDNSPVKKFEGVADAPFLPSLQAAYNIGDWSLQFNFSVPAGGGACDFEDGLGSFESVVGGIAQRFKSLDVLSYGLNGALGTNIPYNGTTGYSMDGYMQGRQYYFGFQFGSAYKVSEHLSVYGGLRILYGTATYKARISNIMVNTHTDNGDLPVPFEKVLPNVTAQVQQLLTAGTPVLTGLAAKEAAGVALSEQEAMLKAGLENLAASRDELSKLAKYSEGVNLLCNQFSVGVAPVVSVDYRLNDHFNFAAKYEFKTQVRMKNESTVNKASEIPAVNKFRDGEKVNEDIPALLTVGAMWSPISDVRINAGWHHYFDKSAEWYNDAQKDLDHDSNEFLLGAEWDVNDHLTVSLGGQLTRYGLSDKYMNDMSFVTNSYSIGFGANYKFNDTITFKAGYFQTDYDNYDRKNYPTEGVHDTFTRTNSVLGLGVEVTL